MPHLHLPQQHTEEDLALAGALAHLLESDELFVAWSVRSGRSRPAVPAAFELEPRAPAPARPPWVRLVGWLLGRR